MTQSNHVEALCRRFRWPVVVLLLAVYALAAITSIREKSATYDEVAHIAGGYSYWRLNDYRLYPEQGNLPQRLAALPLMAGDYKFPSDDNLDWQQSKVFSVADQFLYESENDAARMLFLSRTMMVFVGMGLGLAVYFWSSRIFGFEGGIVALALFAFSPNMLAHGRLATSDLVTCLGFVTAMWSVWAAIHFVTIRRVCIAGVCLGMLAVCKFSSAIMAPMAVLVVVVRLVIGRPMVVHLREKHLVRGRAQQLLICVGSFATQLLLCMLIIWTCYGFRFSPFGKTPHEQMEYGVTVESLCDESSSTGRVILTMNKLRILPKSYLHGLAFVLKTKDTTHISFFKGEYSTNGFGWYFPYCFLVKTPCGTIVVMVLAAVASFGKGKMVPQRNGLLRWYFARRKFYAALPLWIFLTVYATMALNHPVNVGLRHVLPIYPFAFVLAGAAGSWFVGRKKWMRGLIFTVLVAAAVESLLIWPHYLAFFNPIDGGPRTAYRQVIDSSLDWGQDLPGLKKWIATSNPDSEPVYLAYFGSGNPNYYRIEAETLRLQSGRGDNSEVGAGDEWKGGIYCISATTLQSVYTPAWGKWTVDYENQYRAMSQSNRRAAHPDFQPQLRLLRLARLYAFLRQREPDDHVGYSILIFRLTDKDVDEALHGPPAEYELNW